MEEDGGKEGGRERERETRRCASARASQRQPSAQYGRPHQPSDLLTNEWERCQSVRRGGRDAPHYSRG